MSNRAAQIRGTGLLVLLILLLALSACDGADLDAPILGSAAPGDSTGPATVTVPVPATPSATPEIAPSATPVADDAAHYPVAVQIDTETHHPISPLIYGVADPSGGNAAWLRWLGVTLVRWGGNARTRYNWEINASNAGGDWEYRNVSQGDNVAGSAALQFLARNLGLGAQSLLTIPTLGWVARDKNNETRALNVPGHGGPAVKEGADSAYTDFSGGQWIHPYDPTANRKLTSLPSFPRKDSALAYPPNLKDGKVYQDEWVAYLRSQRAADAPAPIYAMDNEPELWADSAHVDVHPVRSGYESMLANFLDYAQAVKDVDPAGLIAGPESWGVTGYMYSALDAGTDQFGTAADRAAHGNLPWLAWFLKSVRAHDETSGRRTLDILDVHYYPNAGQYTGGNDPTMQDLRMQAPRALWDGLYVEPSWVARTEWRNLALLRRLGNMITQYYPGTKLGISEWNFGGENDISGAVATADALGIFGREGVYSAAYWQAPTQASPSGWAFRLYRNYDGQGATFGSESLAVTSSDTQMLSSYAALDPTGQQMTIMLINKDRSRSADVVLQPPGFTSKARAMTYTYNPANLQAIVPAPLVVADPARVAVTLPAVTITLLVLDRE